jgi:transcriptional regulator with XRE-family HTH domain
LLGRIFTMLYFAGNIRYLRDKRGMSTRMLAEALEVSRSRLAKYEGNTQAPYELLLKISRYFNVSVDLLLTVDLAKYSLDDIVNLSDNRIVLPIKVGRTGENKIEIIPYKAQMGYVNGFSDPDYIEGLQHISLPFLRNGKYRGFPAEGDSMPPFKDGTYIIGKYTEKIIEMKVGKNYLIVTRGGFVYKRLARIGENSIWVESDNAIFEPYEISSYELLEVWEYEYSLLKDYDVLDFTDGNVKELILSLKENVIKLEKHLMR